MKTIWTTGHTFNSEKNLVNQALNAGLESAKLGDHKKAFQCFSQAYIAMNWEAPNEDSELKFKALCLTGHAGFKAHQIQESHKYFSLALEMGERLFPVGKFKERAIIYYSLSQCEMRAGDSSTALKTAQTGLEVLGDSSDDLTQLFRSLVQDLMKSSHATMPNDKSPNKEGKKTMDSPNSND